MKDLGKTLQSVKLASTVQANGEPLTLIFPVVMCKPPISLWSPNSRLRCFPLCSGRESVVCQCFPVYYPACQKNSGRDMRGMHSGELHPILFFFSLSFFSLSSKRCFFSVKRLCFSTPFQCADTPTVRCWNWQKTLSARTVVVPVNSKSTTWKGWFCVC